MKKEATGTMCSLDSDERLFVKQKEKRRLRESAGFGDFDGDKPSLGFGVLPDALPQHAWENATNVSYTSMCCNKRLRVTFAVLVTYT